MTRRAADKFHPGGNAWKVPCKYVNEMGPQQ